MKLDDLEKEVKEGFKGKSAYDDIIKYMMIIFAIPIIIFTLIANYLWKLENTSIWLRIFINGFVIGLYFIIFKYLKNKPRNEMKKEFLEKVRYYSGIESLTMKDIMRNPDDIKKLMHKSSMNQVLDNWPDWINNPVKKKKRICGNCNLEIKDESRFCVYCGHNLDPDLEKKRHDENLDLINVPLDDDLEPDIELGYNGDCENCGDPGKWVIDPYLDDVEGIQVKVCLCEYCLKERCDEI